eukprot:2188358-Pleurochrysis_carterae.AAC.2
MGAEGEKDQKGSDGHPSQRGHIFSVILQCRLERQCAIIGRIRGKLSKVHSMRDAASIFNDVSQARNSSSKCRALPAAPYQMMGNVSLQAVQMDVRDRGSYDLSGSRTLQTAWPGVEGR